jgi:hypothetical protein
MPQSLTPEMSSAWSLEYVIQTPFSTRSEKRVLDGVHGFVIRCAR